MEKQFRVVIVDDHLLVSEGLKQIISTDKYIICGTATCAKDGEELIELSDPDILICDINLPGPKGTELISRIKKQKPWIKVVVLSMCDDRATVHELVEMGIEAYVLKNASVETIVRALDKVVSGQFYISEDIADVLIARFNGAARRGRLTDRELEVLRLILKEYSNREISSMLFISERTVEAHRRNIYQKTSTNSALSLLRWAVENRIVDAIKLS
ncbi:MAG: response regulator transcription factor [Tenuifilaceae bacterium]|jgi:DNA-binding NarL/FixJ family response regulator|nr:response regulator transcription factor [Tenuifilaceae bacterium]